MNAPLSPKAIARHIDAERRRKLDAAVKDHMDRQAAYRRARSYRRDFFQMRRAVNILGLWEACQRDAGTFGDQYSGITLADAVGEARQWWRDSLKEMNRRVY